MPIFSSSIVRVAIFVFFLCLPHLSGAAEPSYRPSTNSPAGMRGSGQPSLSVNSPTASAGNIANIVISHNTGLPLAALQFDLSFDPARGQPNLSQITSTSGVTPTCSRPGGSLTQFRCLFVNFIGTLAPSFVVNVPFAVTPGASPGTFPLNLSAAEFVLPSGNTTPGTLSNGMFTVSALAPAIFSAIPIAASTIGFGAVVQSSSANRNIRLQNSAAAGAAGLLISQCAVIGAGFSLSNPPSFPINLSAGTATDLTIAFDAGSALGIASGTLNCTHSGSGGTASWPLAVTVVSESIFQNGFELPPL